MKKLNSHQLLYLFAFLITCLLIGIGEYLEIYKGLNPCPLCLLQRYVFVGLGVVFILGIILARRRWGQIFIGLVSFIFSGVGIAFSGRQVWLQLLPSQTGANCEVSFQYMIQVLPFTEVIKKVFEGGAGCSEVAWKFMYLSMAQWSLLFFILFGIFSLWQLRR